MNKLSNTEFKEKWKKRTKEINSTPNSYGLTVLWSLLTKNKKHEKRN